MRSKIIYLDTELVSYDPVKDIHGGETENLLVALRVTIRLNNYSHLLSSVVFLDTYGFSMFQNRSIISLSVDYVLTTNVDDTLSNIVDSLKPPIITHPSCVFTAKDKP